LKRFEYQKIYQLEERYWWYEALQRLTVRAIEDYNPAFRSLLDAGCGTGGLLRVLRQKFGGASVVGLDRSEHAVGFCQARGFDRLLRSSVLDIGLRSLSFDIVVCHDVLSQPIDQRRALDELARVLCPGGLLVLNTSALEFLRTPHDRFVSDGRRFTRRELAELAGASGLEVLRATYWNALLLPVIMAIRTARGLVKGASHSALPPNVPYWNGLLGWVIGLETRWLRHHTLPLGMSVFCVARKDAAQVFGATSNDQSHVEAASNFMPGSRSQRGR